MIGIPILDDLSEENLVLVAKGYKEMRVAVQLPSQFSIDAKPESPLIPNYKELSKNEIMTLCKMEIESRLGWIYLKEQIIGSAS